MLTKIWTSLLLSLACLTTIAWFVALMHEKDIRPVRNFVGFLKERSKAGRIVICAFFIAMWIYASTKPEGGNG